MSTRQLILEFIHRYFEEHCYAPSYDEIQKAIGISRSTLHWHMKALFTDGELKNDYDDDFGKARAFRPKGYVCVKKEVLYGVMEDNDGTEL